MQRLIQDEKFNATKDCLDIMISNIYYYIIYFIFRGIILYAHQPNSIWSFSLPYGKVLGSEESYIGTNLLTNIIQYGYTKNSAKIILLKKWKYQREKVLISERNKIIYILNRIDNDFHLLVTVITIQHYMVQ